MESWNYRKKGHSKKDCQSQKGKQGDEQQENNQEVTVTSDVFQDALTLSLENITNL